MNPVLRNLLASVLFFYSKKKRVAFRAKYSRNAMNDAKLRKKGILGRCSYCCNSFIASKSTRIGNFCSIARNVSIGTSSHPIYTLSTHPVAYDNADFGLVCPEENRLQGFEDRKPVVIEHDVWIGVNAIIMDGVHISTGAIIGSGAVVTHDIPAYAIAVGVPAQIIRYRFDSRTIERLLASRWWLRPDEFLKRLP